MKQTKEKFEKRLKKLRKWKKQHHLAPLGEMELKTMEKYKCLICFDVKKGND